ncbi:MAG TPA: choice-of-anchor V domain-containing protein [Bacteroidia bacterium]|jgi:hypothetical protein|nr:choice-of-anchor V domain-containing protein [Bacteroidia bacterium]
MKQKRLFTVLGIVVAGISISAFTVLSSNGSQTFETNSPPDGPGDCSGCHSGGSATPVANITASPAFGSGNTYMPGVTYTVSVNVTGYPYFGFDLEMINGQTASSVDGGTVGPAISNTRVTTGPPTNISHSAPIATSSAGTFKWKAPTSGSVYIYASLLGVNHNGSTSGDKLLKYTSTLVPSPTSVQNIAEKNNTFSFFPNPASDQIHLNYSLDKSAKVVISVYDMNGRLAATLLDQTQDQGEQNFDAALPSSLSKGIYTLNLMVDGQATVKKLVIR